MMTEQETPPSTPWLRKLVIPGLIGGVAGFTASFALMRFIDSETVGGLDTSATVAALVGALYLLAAFSILVGTANPGLGARFLNVEDADELREQKRVLLYSGGAMLLWGIALLALALAAPDGPLPQGVALVLGGGGLVLGTALSVLVYRGSDELMLAVNLEASALTYGLVLLVVGFWAMLAHLGYVTGPQPLDLLTTFYVLVLVASFVVIGRRGMLAIR
ncbi:MAG: hypothetical protein V2I74_07725 [Erythrobacter sp.]|jgi:hypothetical protein|nr:hypothetical protein [Erythrobacter sp.]